MVMCLPATGAIAEEIAGTRTLDSVEPGLINAIHKLNSEELDEALLDVREVLDKSPRFHLAQLVYADLLMAKAGMPVQLGLPMAGNEKSRAEDLLNEARARWQRYQDRITDNNLPDVLMQLSPLQKTAVAVDLSRSRLYLYENESGTPRLLADFYVSSGKNGEGKRIEGDKRTPLGVYFVTSSLDISKLPDLYGTGAFPIDYPNAWDRRQGNTGYGIWLHGVPSDTYSRAPRASDGCLAMSNSELDAIKPFLETGVTPVIIGKKLDWLPREDVIYSRQELMAAVRQWQQDWQSLDTETYLGHYSKSFASDNKDYNGWAAHKRRVNRYKSYIKVELDNISILGYPQEKDMAVVSFEQAYQSDNLSSKRNKRQYWRKEADGQWRIVYEGKG